MGHAGHQTLQASHRDIGPLIQQGLSEFMGVMCGMIQVVDCTSQFAPHTRRGCSEGICRLVHFSDVILLQIISHYPRMMRRSIVILVAKIISKVLPSKWNQGVPQDVSMHHAINVPIQEHKGWFCTPVECAPDMDRTSILYPPAWTLSALQSCWKRSPDSRWSQQGLPQDSANRVASGHKCVVNRLTANMHSIQIPHPLSEGTGNPEVVFMGLS